MWRVTRSRLWRTTRRRQHAWRGWLRPPQGPRARVSGGFAAASWRSRASTGRAEPDPNLKRVAQAVLDEHRFIAVQGDRRKGELRHASARRAAARPLQLRFAPGRAPDKSGLAQLASFAVRATHALRSSERARGAGFELERSRALLAVVAGANARLSLSRTVERRSTGCREHARDRSRCRLSPQDDGRVTVARSGSPARTKPSPSGLLASRARVVPAGGGSRSRTRRWTRGWARLGPSRARRGSSRRSRCRSSSATGRPACWRSTRGGRAAEGQRERTHRRAGRPARRGRAERALHERAPSSARLEQALAGAGAGARVGALYEISSSFTQSLSLEPTLAASRSGRRSARRRRGGDPAAGRARDELVARARPRATSTRRRARRARAPAAARAARAAALLPPTERPLLLDADRPAPAAARAAAAVPRGGHRRSSRRTQTELLGTLTILSLDPGAGSPRRRRPARSRRRQAALTIDNARLYHIRKRSRTRWRGRSCRARPEIEGLEVGHVYESSAHVEVGGDVYDFLTLDDGRLAVVLGDVTGHGVEAAADMAMAKFVFRSLAREHPEPSDFLAAANEIVCDDIAPGSSSPWSISPSTARQGSSPVRARASVPPDRPARRDRRGSRRGGLALGIEAAGVREVRETSRPVRASSSTPTASSRRAAGVSCSGSSGSTRAVRAPGAAGRGARRGRPGLQRVDTRRARRRLRDRRHQADSERGGARSRRRRFAALVFGAGTGSLAVEIAASGCSRRTTARRRSCGRT